MIAFLAAAVLLNIGVAGASLRADNNTTETASITVVPLVPIIAVSKSNLDVPPTTSEVPTTYLPAETSNSLDDYVTSGAVPESTSSGMSSPIALTSYETAAKPTLTHTSSGVHLAGNSSRSDRIVHTERTQHSLDTPSTYPPVTYYPSPIALSKYSSAATPTLPASPIALSSYSTAAGPTLPPSHTGGPPSYTPAIVHTEVPAESLDVPSGETHPGPSQGTTQPVRPVPGAGNGQEQSSSAVPQQSISVPTTLVTMAPNMIVTMGGYQSTIVPAESGQPAPTEVVTTIPSQVVTMSDGQITTVSMAVYTLPILPVTPPSDGTMTSLSSTTTKTSNVEEPTPTASNSGSGSGEGSQAGGNEGEGNDEEGGALKLVAGSWKYQLLCMALGTILLR